MKTYFAAAATVAVIGMAGAASAAPILCPGTVATNDREVGVETTPVTAPPAMCYQSGGGNDPGAFAGFEYLDKDESPDEASAPGFDEAYFTIAGLGGTSGSFAIDASVWNSFDELIFVLKFGGAESDNGQNAVNPDWVAFKLSPEVTGGTWSVSVPPGIANTALSHGSLYGQRCTDGNGAQVGCDSVVAPEPASMLLMGLGLLGLAARFRRQE